MHLSSYYHESQIVVSNQVTFLPLMFLLGYYVGAILFIFLFGVSLGSAAANIW
jgi:uncharacterized membrane protein YbjE (DUF340 family)